MLRAKWIRNAPDGNGTLFRGDIYQVPMAGLLGGTTGHRIWETKTAAQYSIGTRLITEDGRVFRYAKAAAACKAKYGAKNLNEEAISYTAATAAQAVGDTTIKCTVAATDGAGGDGVIAKDELTGGFVVIYNSGDTIRQHRCILANTAAASSSITITLDMPLTTAVTLSTSAFEVLGNPYNGILYTNNTYSSVLGVAMVEAAAAEYFWIQTWGPICITPGSATTDPGADAEERAVQFDGEGSLICYADGSSKDRQEAGFIIQADSSGAAGPPFIMLQISP